MQVKQNNFIVLINPFYKPTNYVRQVLSENRIAVTRMCSGMKNKALIIADSLKEYLGEQPHMHLKDFSKLCWNRKEWYSVWPP